MTSVEAYVGPDGSIRMIYSDSLAAVLPALGDVTVARASHVEPAVGGWEADLSPVGGPVLGPFVLRADALAAEVAYLREHSIPVPR